MSTPQTTAAFLNTLGVNVHVEYTDGKYANVGNVIADLAYLGVTRVRDAVLNPGNQGQSSYDALASAGIKFDLFSQGNDLSSTLALVDAFVKRHPGAVSMIEGPNEVNNFPISYAGQSGNAAAVAYQNALYAAVKADPLLAGVMVANLTTWPFLGGASDYANTHFYPFSGAQPGASAAQTMSALAVDDHGKPQVMTEAGYNTLLSDTYFGGVDQPTQAKLLLNLYCDNAKLGVAQTYVYQLLDAYADPNNSNSDSHFGLFNLDNSPKVAATAIHNLTTILSAGSDASAAATNLAFTTSGLPSSGSVLAFTKSAMVHDLLIWSEPNIWNGQTHTAVTAATSPVTLHLNAAANVTVFDPLSSSGPIASFQATQDVVIAVTDHPLVVEVSDIAATTPVTSTPVRAAAPAITGATALALGDHSTANIFSGVNVAAATGAQSETVTVSFAPSAGSLAGGGFSSTTAGVYQLTASSAAAAQAALRALVFTPTVQPSGTAATTTAFTVSITDANGAASDASTIVTASHQAAAVINVTPTTAATAVVTTVASSAAATAPVAGASAAAPSPAATDTFATLTIEAQNLLRFAGASDSGMTTAMKMVGSVAAQVASGQMTDGQASSALLHLADGTTSVAQMTYQFFTGSTPTAAGLSYLVHSDGNANDLNDAYYAQFSTGNRFINFASNLAKGGAGTGDYHAAYDGLSLQDATAKAYTSVFGAAPTVDKVATLLNAQVPDGHGGVETRADYFAAYGGDGPNGTGTKAAMIGWLLSEAVAEDVGPYAAAETNFLQDLAHGTPRFGVDLLSAYAAAPTLVGQAAADAHLGGLKAQVGRETNLRDWLSLLS